MSLTYHRFRNQDIEIAEEQPAAADDFSNVWLKVNMPEMIDEAPSMGQRAAQSYLDRKASSRFSSRARSAAGRAYSALPGETPFEKGQNIVDIAAKGVSAFKKFKDLFTGLVGRGGERHVDKLGDIEDARQALKAQKETVKELARKIENGQTSLETREDIERFREIAKMSDIYRDEGSRIDNDQRIAKHIDIIIAKNVANQIRVTDHKLFMVQFMDNVSSDNFCG